MAYEDCSSHFNKGIAQFHEMSADPGPENSRWHLAQGAFLEALEAAMRYPGVFLKTTVSVSTIHILIIMVHYTYNVQKSSPNNCFFATSEHRAWTTAISSAKSAYLSDNAAVNYLTQKVQSHGAKQQ